MPQVMLNSLAESEQWAKDMAQTLTRPCLVLLDGELGAGKTQMVRWLVEAMGGAAATSPTFAIHQSYESPSGSIDHVDLYRLEGWSDLESAGIWDLLKQKEAMIFVEWAARIPAEMWPKNFNLVRIHLHTVVDRPSARTLEFSV